MPEASENHAPLTARIRWGELVVKFKSNCPARTKSVCICVACCVWATVSADGNVSRHVQKATGVSFGCHTRGRVAHRFRLTKPNPPSSAQSVQSNQMPRAVPCKCNNLRHISHTVTLCEVSKSASTRLNTLPHTAMPSRR